MLTGFERGILGILAFTGLIQAQYKEGTNLFNIHKDEGLLILQDELENNPEVINIFDPMAQYADINTYT